MKKVIYTIISGVLLILLITCGCTKKKSSEVGQRDTVDSQPTGKATGGEAAVKQGDVTKSVSNPTETTTANQGQMTKAATVSPRIKKLIDEMRYWNLVGEAYYGINMPNISMTDIKGKTHNIADYKGKNIIVFSFASWCPGCAAQVEFFKLLSQMYGQDKYVILGVAAKTERDDIEKLKEYIKEKKISYAVIYLEPSATPTPFNMNMFVPCSYFIGADGTFKIGIEDIIRPKDLIKIFETQ